MTPVIHVDTSVGDRKVKAVRRKMTTAMEDIASGATRHAAFTLAQYTLPKGDEGNQWKFSEMGKRIKEDIGSTYHTKDDDDWQNRAYRMIQDHLSEERAKRWWQSYKKGGSNEDGALDYETEFDKMRGIPRKTNEQEYLAYRKQHNNSMPVKGSGSHRSLGFVTQDKRNAFIKKRKKTMGLAKAGWYAVFKISGGRVRRKQSKAEGKETWPKEINTPFRIFGGVSLGTLVTTFPATGFHVLMTNKVRYADEAFNESLKNRAYHIIGIQLKKMADLRLKHGRLWKREFDKAA